MFNPFKTDTHPVVDVETVEPSTLVHPDQLVDSEVSYPMSQAQRKLIADFITEAHQGDLVMAVQRICGKLTVKQQPQWEIFVRNAASAWANARNAHLDASDRQLTGAMYFANLLLGQEQHRDDRVAARLRSLSPSIRETLALAFVNADTQGQYNRARTKLIALVPGIVGAREMNSEDSQLFEVTGPLVPANGGDEEPF